MFKTLLLQWKRLCSKHGVASQKVWDIGSEDQSGFGGQTEMGLSTSDRLRMSISYAYISKTKKSKRIYTSSIYGQENPIKLAITFSNGSYGYFWNTAPTTIRKQKLLPPLCRNSRLKQATFREEGVFRITTITACYRPWGVKTQYGQSKRRILTQISSSNQSQCSRI